MKNKIILGLDRFLADPKRYASKRIGLIANPSTVDSRFRHAFDLFMKHPDILLTSLFGPEHGALGDAQYMEAVANTQPSKETSHKVNYPTIYSLYGSTFESLTPTDEALAGLDTLIFDVQDVGARYYTYAATMALAMKACARLGKQMLVLDRPNPIANRSEGGGLKKGLENFCALYPLPQRHGMTVGELAKYYNSIYGIDCDLKVLPCKNLDPCAYMDEQSAPWVMPSPNMPTVKTAVVYPGMCLLEGTNISEARGTTRPFELFGAPWIKANALYDELMRLDLPGVEFRQAAFVPTFDKYEGKRCYGFQMHVINRDSFLPYKTGLAIIHACKKLFLEFKWRTEPYEFRDDVPAFDLLTGDPHIRQAIDNADPFMDIYTLALQGAEEFHENKSRFQLYY